VYGELRAADRDRTAALCVAAVVVMVRVVLSRQASNVRRGVRSPWASSATRWT